MDLGARRQSEQSFHSLLTGARTLHVALAFSASHSLLTGQKIENPPTAPFSYLLLMLLDREFVCRRGRRLGRPVMVALDSLGCEIVKRQWTSPGPSRLVEDDRSPPGPNGGRDVPLVEDADPSRIPRG